MAELIIPEDCGLVTSSWSFSGKTNPITTTVGIHALAEPDPGAFLSEYYNGWVVTDGYSAAARMSPSWTFEGCTMIWNAGGGVFEGYSQGPPVTGTGTQPEEMIVSSAVLCQKRTARAGRHFRGRHYLPAIGIAEASISPMGIIGNVPFGFAQAAMAETADFWLASTTWETVILHADDTITPGFTPITSFSLQQKTATQRRRLRS